MKQRACGGFPHSRTICFRTSAANYTSFNSPVDPKYTINYEQLCMYHFVPAFGWGGPHFCLILKRNNLRETWLWHCSLSEPQIVKIFAYLNYLNNELGGSIKLLNEVSGLPNPSFYAYYIYANALILRSYI